MLYTWFLKSPDADPVKRQRACMDDVIDVYKKDIDRRLIREMLKLTPEQRILRMLDFIKSFEDLRATGKETFGRKS